MSRLAMPGRKESGAGKLHPQTRQEPVPHVCARKDSRGGGNIFDSSSESLQTENLATK